MRVTSIITVMWLCVGTAAADDKNEKAPANDTIEVFAEDVAEQDLFIPVSFGGFVEANDSRVVGAEIDGTLNKVFVQLGERVKRGQRLFNLHPKGAGLDYRMNSVYSPIAGVVSAVEHGPGKFLQAGEGVLTIADPSKLVIEIHVTYDDLPTVKPGASPQVVLTGPDKKEVRAGGLVKNVSPSAHPALGTFPAEVAIQCDESTPCQEMFKLGTFVRTIFQSDLHRGVKLDAKYLVNQRRKAILLKKDHTVTFVDVELGRFFGSEVEILKGLSPGDRIVTSFSKFPKEGEYVIVKAKEDEKDRVYSAESKDKKVDKS